MRDWLLFQMAIKGIQRESALRLNCGFFADFGMKRLSTTDEVPGLVVAMCRL